MAGGVRGGRGAREILGARESLHETKPRADLAVLPGELGAERRLPEFAEAEATKRRFDAGHRETVEYEFHRAFEVFHERKGPGLFPGKRGFLFLPGFRKVSPADFASAKPKEETRWDLESLWSAVQSSGAMILFLPLAFPIKSGTVDSLLGIHSGQFWFTSLSRALNLGLSPSSILNWLGIRDKDSGFRLKPNHTSYSDDIFRMEPLFLPPEFFVPKRARGGLTEVDTTAKDSELPASRTEDITDFSQPMNLIKIRNVMMEKLRQRGFKVGEDIVFAEKLEQAPTAKSEGEIAAATFFERKRVEALPPLRGEGAGMSLHGYNAEIFWDASSYSWSLRSLHDRLPLKEKDPEAVHWTLHREGTNFGVIRAEIPLILNDTLHTTMRVNFLKGVVVEVQLSLRWNFLAQRKEIVVLEKFSKEDPGIRGPLPTWGRFLRP